VFGDSDWGGVMPSAAKKQGKGTPLPRASAWLPLHLQLIAFPTESPIAQERNWWEELTGSPPEATARKPHQERTDQGTFEGVTLTVAADMLRITWTASPRIEVDNLLAEVPTLGPFPSAQDQFVQLMSGWLAANCPAITRLAFAGKLVQFTKSHEMGYRRLAAYLPRVAIDADTSDFMYRINRKRDSAVGISGLRINRLATWSFITISTQMRVANAVGRVPPPIKRERSACSLDFDINTVPEYEGELPQAELSGLLKEFSGIAIELAQHGDVR
jgi:hypothetical protein